ncbi:GNAT family N-acetyltransferase [Rubrobacter radiotolerans]|uniref:GNAT family protein n=1 Tax=Rubrobacter radiotolerans TaxID=42256 RepID=A0AB35T613_RUBRA|nr:GNAT family protein [Rubrobacter radiotolerans]MDX5895329.1 GNAT family protein [Rubrobacter radiotolerans]
MFVKLAAVDEGDYELMARWLGPSVGGALGMGTQSFISAETVKEYFGGRTGNCAIIKTREGEKIGFISWHTQRYEGSYEIGGIVGEPKLWDSGCGADAALAVIHHLFHDRNAHRLQFTTGLYNKRAVGMVIKLLEEREVVLEGVLRDHCFLDGEYHDAIVVSILRDEWYAKMDEVGDLANTIPEAEKEEARLAFRRYVEEHWKDDIGRTLIS